MRILITGICGFVGNTLAFGLKEESPDWEILGIDNLVRAGSEMNRSALRRRGIRFIHGDIRNPSDLESVPRCDWIVDAAANPSVLAGVDGKTSSRQLIEHNLGGTVNLLELVRHWQSGFLMLSTSRVYSIRDLAAIPVEARGDRFEVDLARSQLSIVSGQWSVVSSQSIVGSQSSVVGGESLEGGVAKPVRRERKARRTDAPLTTDNGQRTTDESQVPLSKDGVRESFSTEPPLSLYGSSKRASEILALEYAEAFALPVFINRCGVLAGAGQFGKIDQGIFSYWIHSWRVGRPLKYIGFNGTGFQVRDCLHARDLLPLVVAQMKKPRARNPRVLNVSGGMGNSASLRQLSAWCEQRFGKRTVAVEKTTRPFDVPWLVLDSSLANSAWNWKPQASLETIWSEIADHAERHPDWLDATAD